VSEVSWWGWVLAVAAGSGGALLRTSLVHSLSRRPFPFGVLAANVVASVVGGAAGAERGAHGVTGMLVVVGGYCGGLTTLTTLAADTVELWLEHRRGLALANVAVNVALGLAAVWGAWALLS
jgi:CrcB protein